MAKLNSRRCKQCGEVFQKEQQLQSLCSIKCAIERSHELNKKKREKELKDKVKVMKTETMTRGEWIKLLQATFNTYIRLRDEGQPCISCDCDMSNRKGDASHFYPTTYQYLRFNELNVHLACVPCNQFKHGNLQEYLPRLEKKIGVDAVQKLHHDRHKRLELTLPDIKNLITDYKLKIKQLKNG